MRKYALLKNGVVESTHRKQKPGYVPVPEWVECGDASPDDGQTFLEDDSRRVAAIKTACREGILDQTSLADQNNKQSRALELMETRIDGGELSESEASELAKLKEWRAWVEAMRAKCASAIGSGIAADVVTWPAPPTP